MLVVMGVLAGLALTDGVAQDADGIGALAALVLIAGGPLVVYLKGGYLRSRRPLGNLPIELGRLLAASGFAVWLAAVVIEATDGRPQISTLTGVWLVITAGWFVGRLLAARRVRSHPEVTLLVGSGEMADRVVALTRRHPEHGLRIVGVVDDDPVLGPDAPPYLGPLAALPRLLSGGGFDRVIIAFTGAASDATLAQTLRVCTPRGVRVDVVPRLFHLMGTDATVEVLGDLSLVQVGPPTASVSRRAAKRAFDVAVSALGLLICLPLMLAIAVAVRLDSRGPVFFRQTRIGRQGIPFRFVKFRSMTVGSDASGLAAAAAVADRQGSTVDGELRHVVASLKSDDGRITRVGRLLRRTSLDELPQLWNVLRGDMSLVGPRPLRPFEAAALEDWQRARHEVRPGLTGLWQVMGRSDISWDERMQMDYIYVRHWSLRQDLRVLARTLQAVLRQDGAG